VLVNAERQLLSSLYELIVGRIDMAVREQEKVSNQFCGRPWSIDGSACLQWGMMKPSIMETVRKD